MRIANLNNLFQSTNFLIISSNYFSQKSPCLFNNHLINHLHEYKESY
jgi:hypothetical protein